MRRAGLQMRLALIYRGRVCWRREPRQVRKHRGRWEERGELRSTKSIVFFNFFLINDLKWSLYLKGEGANTFTCAHAKKSICYHYAN